ncbi:MAG: PEP/pyruvate-binding domain-containing protein [Myxococcota bacterium]|nr:PEP/pyruvate-binding domain-containing protein [Myxococcota bacterium]
MKLPQWLLRFLGLKKDAQNIEALRAEFKVHSHDFKLLLIANNQALELMNEVEAALKGNRPFEMNFVHTKCCRIAANVYRMIHYLNELAPGKYDLLFDRYLDIQEKIGACITYTFEPKDSPMVMNLCDLDRSFVDWAGGKMSNLGELKQEVGINIPDGFVVTLAGFQLFMNHDNLQLKIGKTTQSLATDEYDYFFDLSELLTDMILAAPFPPALEAEILSAYNTLCAAHGRDMPVAVRSSSPLEDLPGKSMAGQYYTELGVMRTGLLDAYKKVVASKYSYQSMAYRRQLGVRDEDMAMCVGFMPMVEAVSGGVLYTSDPLDPTEDCATIFSVFGLPKAVVDGTAPVDRFSVCNESDRQIIKKEIASKPTMLTAVDAGGYQETNTESQAFDPSLSDDQACELATIAKTIETYYDAPQDIEWALDKNGQFVILQSRPLAKGKQESRLSGIKSPRDLGVAPLLEGGVAAGSGIASGAVFIVRSERDMLRFPPNAVLVSTDALPIWAVLMDRAAAVITEGGSVAGHLACVARESGIPALFGTPGATAVLKDGQLVTVDADDTSIFPGRVGTPTLPPQPLVSHIEGTSVYESLKCAAAHILPLNLLNPNDPGFTPGHCTTIHDITRFCHEMSVKEMFSFGADRSFPELASRQLFVEVPMQFWLIDLDDGFTGGAKDDGRFIRLEHIASKPMLALWRGMTAIPWAGPPPVDAKGFLSVMFESTANPDLESAGHSNFAERNYLMVTKNFVSLQSRFGYHFATVESLLGECDRDNYLNFMFKGGAANVDRRVLRSRLVAEVLEARGIRAQCVGDAVSARMENCESHRIRVGLETIGYIIMHTRQLDMAMSGEAAVKEYKAKILADLDSLNAE